MTRLKVEKFGDSLGIVLPSEILERLQAQEGDEIVLMNDAEGVRLAPPDPDFESAMDVFEKGRHQYRNALRRLAE